MYEEICAVLSKLDFMTRLGAYLAADENVINSELEYVIQTACDNMGFDATDESIRIKIISYIKDAVMETGGL